MTLFAAIATLPHEPTGRPDLAGLRALNFDVPDDVFEQVLYDHGNNPEFQAQYRALDLRAVRWDLQELEAEQVAGAAVYKKFKPWTDTAASRARRVAIDGWRAVDTRRDVVRSWEERGTWLRPPVLIRGSLLGSPADLHVMEGHTRVGLLRGLLAVGAVAPSSKHKVWVGSPRAATA